MRSPILPILWAQWRIMTNFRAGGVAASARALAVAATLIWYAVWAGLGHFAGTLALSAEQELLHLALPWVLLAVSAYWQVMPVATASLGATLDLRKLLAWPIPERSLFAIEAMLRLAATFEIALFLAAGGVGLARNPGVPAWGTALALLGITAFNTFLATGLTSLLERVFARRWLREAAVLIFVVALALPQLILYTGPPETRRFTGESWIGWPWTAAARLALGERAIPAAVVLLAWIAAAYAFGGWQFRRSLSFDMAAASSTRAWTSGRLDRVYRLPSLLFRDPLAALLEKELRTLARAPRFRLLFLMGFSFGFLIWLPVIAQRSASDSIHANYPVYVALYGVVLLGEVTVWNVFGFDRSAARLYFSAPISLSAVLVAKNLATLTVVLIEAAVIAVVCAALPLSIPPMRLVDAVLVAFIAAEYLIATGNMSSVYYPKSVDPEHSWGRQASTRFHLYLLVLFPILLTPVLLAYLARYAFNTDLAFYLTLLFAFAIGAVYYWVALDSAVQAGTRLREQLLETLSATSGPLATS